MIIFNGYLTGKAEKYFMKRARALIYKVVFFSFLLLLPPVFLVASSSGLFFIFHIYFILIVVSFAATFIPIGKKSRTLMTPKKILIEEEFIVCITDQSEEIRRITDVKKVYNYDEFYEIVLPFGKKSGMFVCQKELLQQGSLRQFEKLFEGKIEKR